MPLGEGIQRLRRLREDAARARQRRLVVLAGRPDWARPIARALADWIPPERGLYIGDSAPLALPVLDYSRATTRLGSELELLCYDTRAGFDPDAFGALAGAVVGGGLLVLLTPPLDEWPDHADPAAERITLAGYGPETVGGRLIRRLAQALRADPHTWIWAEDHPPPRLPPVPPTRAVEPVADPDCATADQARAVALVESIARATGPATAVLTADRGRGKSAALGIAAARLLDRPGRRIVVTAPRPRAAAAVFAQAQRVHPQCRRRGNALQACGAVLEFAAPDALLRTRPPAELLLVDEAAGIPAPMLLAMLAGYPRTVFATTIHGYEGTGRGFAIRFTETLQQLRPGWRALSLSAPVRWAPGDPVERLVDSALLLDAEPASAPAAIEAVAHRALDRDRLVRDEPLLRQIFGLLVNAHYRTTPTDLRNLLDGPATTVHALISGATVLAAALAVDEGGLDEALAAAVWLGWRRPHGHLLPQSLAFHGGHAPAARLRCRRIMRIAVHPARRRSGLGRRLLDALATGARAGGLDGLGVSFGATPQLLDFWLAAGFQLLRLGHRREAASGAHAAMMIRPLSATGETVATALEQRLRADIHTLLDGPLRDLEADLRRRLPAGEPLPEPSADDWLRAHGFAQGQRPLAADLPGLRRIPDIRRASGNEIECQLIQRCINAGQSLTRAGQQLGLTGRKAAEQRLRLAVARQLASSDAPEAAVAAERFRSLRGWAESIRCLPGYRRQADGTISAADAP